MLWMKWCSLHAALKSRLLHHEWTGDQEQNITTLHKFYDFLKLRDSIVYMYRVWNFSVKSHSNEIANWILSIIMMV